MGGYLLRRVLQSIPLLLLISFVLFVLMNSLGDPLAVYAETKNPPKGKAREELERRLGLDKPIWYQYVVWLLGNDWTTVDVRGDGTLLELGKRRGLLRGDLGTSLVTKQPAWARIQERLPNTLILQLPSYVLIILLSVGVGVYSALRQYSILDNMLTGLSFFLFSMPIFFNALVLVYLFGVQFKQWGLPSLPIGAMWEPGQQENLVNLLPHMVMPVFSLIAIQVAGHSRFIRSSMLEVMNQDYIRTARAKGLNEHQTVLIHAFKNAALPLITLVALDLPFLLAGAIVTETIFAWPGMGQLFLQSLDRSDYSVMMAILMLVSVMVVVFQLLADLIYMWLDPRIQYS